MAMILSIQYNCITKNAKIHNVKIKIKITKEVIRDRSLKTNVRIIFYLLNELICKQYNPN